MRKLILVACAALGMMAIVPLATPAAAAGGKWCAKKMGATHCNYATLQQCRASRSGRGGTCFRRQATR